MYARVLYILSLDCHPDTVYVPLVRVSLYSTLQKKVYIMVAYAFLIPFSVFITVPFTVTRSDLLAFVEAL